MYGHSKQLERELAKAQNILKQCLSIMPVGHVPTHTVENLPEMIGDLAKALAEETTEREQLERELAEAREQRNTLAEALELMWPFIEEDDHPNCNTPAFSAAIAKYKAAIATVKGGSHDS
jgi:chromosome segregation ATPase